MTPKWNSNTAMAFMLLYILEKEFGTHLTPYSNGELSLAIRETLDELAFDHIGDMYATDAERSFDPNNPISLIDTPDFAEDVIRIIPPDRPSVGRAHKMLGQVCVQQGDRKMGKEHFEKAIQIFEKHNMEPYLQETQNLWNELI